jgi:oligopeptide/dipeptide ABC transporter ATP-binding protein
VTPEPLVDLRDVTIEYRVSRGRSVSAVQGVTLSLIEGETFGLVGESGCGKTTLSMALMGLLPSNAHVSGEIYFHGRDLVTIGQAAHRKLRGSEMSMVFQDPATSLDPTFSIGHQVAETVRSHQKLSRKQSKARALELLRQVGIPAAEERYRDAPHRLSGGMRQRVVMAAALANDPKLLLADEPTTALDVTIQAQVLDLLAELQVRRSTTILLIAHDLGIVAQTCDRVGVMYAGQLVEVATVAELFREPRHPYTRALLDALPSRAGRGEMLRVIGGQVPDLADPPPGCRFADRCPQRMDICSTRPPLTSVDGVREVACWLEPAVLHASPLAGTAAVTQDGDER